jgi:large subunit ribosomal protein L6
MPGKKTEITHEIAKGAQVKVDGYTVTVSGPKGEVKKEFQHKTIKLTIKDDEAHFTCENATRREKMQMYTFEAHLKNMIQGVLEGHKYKLKVCSGHFPMTVTLSGDTLSVKNFLGEKIARTLKIKKGASVKVEGNDITVESPDKELAGQVAADMEQLTRVTNRDNRIFQDGIYITDKSGKSMS